MLICDGVRCGYTYRLDLSLELSLEREAMSNIMARRWGGVGWGGDVLVELCLFLCCVLVGWMGCPSTHRLTVRLTTRHHITYYGTTLKR